MKYALITGATSGIGFALATIFAQDGYGLALVSSSGERLAQTKKRINATVNAPIHVYEKDLSALGAAREVFDQVAADGLRVETLVNNAGFGLVGRTEAINYDMDEKLMVLNTISVVELCKLFLPAMYKHKSGKILNIASTGAFQPGPFTSTYFASKAFVLSYSKAVRYEAASQGVQVCVLCPGPTKTNFFACEGVDTPEHAMSAERVAKYAYSGLMKDQAVIVPGMRNKLAKSAPEPIKMMMVAKMKQNRQSVQAME